MIHTTKNYPEDMYNKISHIFEATGKGDAGYQENQKAIDIFEVLETLLAFAIYNTSHDKESVSRAAEVSYFNIKSMALDAIKHQKPNLKQ